MLLLLLTGLLVPILILPGAAYLGGRLLKRKLSPNEVYLNEIAEIECTAKFKLLIIINSIIGVIMIAISNFHGCLVLWFIISFIIESIRSKYKLDYLSTKLENDNTRKYILYQLGLTFVLMMIGLSYYLIYYNLFC